MKGQGFSRWLGMALVGLGLALVGLAAAYYAYAAYADAQLGRLNQSQPLAPSSAPPSQPPAPLASPTPGPPAPQLLIAERISIPAIGVNSRIIHIGTYKDEKGNLIWERPVFSVGHVRWTAQPGQGSNIVMTGHISSPIEKEGEVFKRLPEIPELLAQGKPVEVVLYTAQERFVYQVTQTMVVEPTDAWVMDPTPEETLTLITCVPDYVYSQRLIVTAKPVPGSRSP